jgi:hypothetical protein
VTIYTFTPPIDFEITPLGDPTVDNPLGCRLMRYYSSRPCGVTVYKMSDGTYRTGRYVEGLTYGPQLGLLDAWPPVQQDVTIWGNPSQPNGCISTSWFYSVITAQEFQTPAVTITYYGGHSYTVTSTEAADLTAAGLGAYVT